MILDTQPNIHDYIQEHIPGAIYLNEGLFRTFCGNQPARWVLPESIEPVLRGAGLKADKPAVVYTGVGINKGWGDGLAQTMVAYSLARYGHDAVHVLNGGIDQWKQEGNPLTQVFPQVQASNFTAKVRREYMIDYEEFIAIKDRGDVMLLDARPPAVYEGQGPWIKPSHIPGAINLPWANLMDNTNKCLLKSLPEIQAILEAKGITPDKTIICSCGTGREATNEFLLFTFHLGYPKVRLHEGAFTEWTAYPENPTITGKNPRSCLAARRSQDD